MDENFAPPAIGEITDPDQIRVLIFINRRVVHAPLTELVKHLQEQIADLEARVTDLETP